jgi:hypothetical protein
VEAALNIRVCAIRCQSARGLAHSRTLARVIAFNSVEGGDYPQEKRKKLTADFAD